MEEKRQMAAEAASLSRMGSGILGGLRVVVKWLFDGSLGYTHDGVPKEINVTWNNETYMSSLSPTEKIFFRMGVFAHEVLHQVFTNFKYSNKICNELSQAEAAIFMKFANTLEDPAIEYFAPNVMGGKLLKALKFTIAHIYKLSPTIDKSSSAFSQLINALINFGDMGVVKGNFTYPEAYEYFCKVAPLYNEGITCPNSIKRLDIAKKCMEITEPLWREHVKNEEEWQKLIEELLEFLKQHGSPQMDNPKDPGSDEKSDRRGASIKSMSGESDDDSDEENDEEASNTNSENDSTPDSEDKDSKGKKSKSKPSKESKSKHSQSENFDSSENKEDSSDNVTADKETAEQLAEDYAIDDNEMEEILKELNDEADRIEKEENKDSKNPENSEIPSFEINSPYFKNASCINARVVDNSSSMKSTYVRMKNDNKWEINILAKSLKKLFDSDKEENNRATSGEYNIKRGTIGCSARIFDKRRDPSNKKDVAVVLCIDLSGSMSSFGKIEQARKMAIVFTEALSQVGIKHHIMGFHADTRGSDAYHEHFVTFDGKGKETIATMRASANNFDGYSIRYAANLLKNRPEENKILFVISDGLPACFSYKNGSIGNADITLAVKESRKMGNTTFGIALGNNCTPEVIQSFYGKDFIACEDPTLLTNTVCKKLEKMFK